MEIYGIIYLLIDGTNDKEYVGQTTRSLEARFYQHKHSDQYIDRIIKTRGEDLIATAILKECYSKGELDYLEKHFIKSRDTLAPNGYNLTEGGEGGIPCEETCAKISASKSGEKHPFFGKHHTPQHCANISKALTGKPKSPEHRKKDSESHKGKIPNDETRAKMSEVRRGKKLNPRSAEDCAKISAKNRGETPYKNLLTEIEEHQLSYSTLAKILDIKISTMSFKMRGKRNFTARDKLKLAELFDKPIDFLFQRDEKTCPNPSESHRKVSPYKNLQRELDTRSLSYGALAKLIKLTHQSLARKMRGERSFMEKEKAQIAQILGLSIEYIFKSDK